MLLYHGAKSGIKGDIKPYSRDACDFGCGFYMGDKEDQPKGLIAAFPSNKFYEIEYDAEGLTTKEFGDDYISQIDWALFIAFNRGYEGLLKYENLKLRYEKYNKENDMITEKKLKQFLKNLKNF